MLSIALAFGLLWPIPETVVFLPQEVRTALVVMGLVVLTGAF